jgi:hypothetical protein
MRRLKFGHVLSLAISSALVLLMVYAVTTTRGDLFADTAVAESPGRG